MVFLDTSRLDGCLVVDVSHFARKIYKVPNFEPRLETFGIQLTAPLNKIIFLEGLRVNMRLVQ